MKQSIQPTYDSRETGPAYSIRTSVNGVPLEPSPRKLDDPFVRHTVTVDWRDLLRSLFRRRLVVEILIDGDRERMDDVLELDNNQLIAGRTRRVEFQAGMHERLKSFAIDEELREITEQ